MDAERLAQRRRWFRSFPEGTLEFAIITRVLALMLLMALAIVGGTQRPLVLVALAIVLWVEYAMLIWWLVQLGTDLRELTDGSAGDSARRRVTTSVKAVLPSVAVVLALAPWGRVATDTFGGAASVVHWVQVAAVVLFLVSLLPAYRALKDARVGASLWTGLLLVPIVHWFALHRLAAGLDRRIDEQLRARGQEKASRPLGLSLPIADATWVLTLLPWAAVLAYSLAHGWSNSSAFKLLPVCGTLLAVLFAIADLAALEGVQRQIVTLIRKASA